MVGLRAALSAPAEADGVTLAADDAGRAICPGESFDIVHLNMYDLSLEERGEVVRGEDVRGRG